MTLKVWTTLSPRSPGQPKKNGTKKPMLTHVSNAKENIAKSNKSELWNPLSYRGLPYLVVLLKLNEVI